MCGSSSVCCGFRTGPDGILALASCLQRLGRGSLGAPAAHALRDDGAVVAARDVVLEARVLEPVRLAHQVGPALEERLADHLGQDPAVLGAEDVDRRRRLAAIAGRHAVGRDHGLLDQQRIAEGDGGRQQRALHPLALAGHLARHQRRHGAEGAVQRRAEIDPGHLRAIGLLLGAGHVDRARHDLADAVEADAVAVGAAAAIGGDGGENDIGLHRLQALVVELHGGQLLRRQVGDHHIGRRHQLAHDLLALGQHGVERKP